MLIIKDILDKIDSFSLKNNNWRELDALLTALMNTKTPEKGINNLFKVLEKFPDRDIPFYEI